MDYENFKQTIEKYKVITEQTYNKLESLFGKKNLKNLFSLYINDSSIPNDDRKFNLTSYYLENIEMPTTKSNNLNDEQISINSNDNKTEEYYADSKQYDPFKIYLEQVSKYPLLTKEQEKKLAQKISDLRNQIETNFLIDDYFEKKLKELNYPHKIDTSIESRVRQIKFVKQQLNLLKNKSKRLKRQSNSIDEQYQELIKELNLNIENLSQFLNNLEIKYNYEKNLETFINSNLKLVIYVAKKYTGRGLDLLELVQEGNIGLQIAADRYDVSKNYKFSTYATWWIRQSITRAIGNNSKTIRIPVHLFEKIKHMEYTEKNLSLKLGREPSLEELSEALEIPVEKTIKYKKINEPIVSLSTPIGEDEDARLSDFIVDSDKHVEEDALNSTLKEQINQALSMLTPREEAVIRLRFGLDDNISRTLEEVGKIYGVTRERIRQIEVKAIRKLRHPTRSKKLLDFYNN